jgi:hypothetical protein
MNERFRDIYPRLIDEKVSTLELIEELKQIGDFSDDLLQALRDQLKAGNETALVRLVHVMFLTPDRKFTPMLCDLLDNHRYERYMEAIADLLMDIRDERAVPAIVRALDHFVESDDDSHFNRKLIIALKYIGTPEAISAIRLTLTSPKALVRGDAEDALKSLVQL